MVFSGIPFLYYFLPATVILYLIAPRALKNAVLLLASLFFYAWGEQELVFLFAGTILAGYVIGLLIDRFRGTALAKVFLWISVLLFIGFLVYFKYTDFFIASINAAFGISIPLLRIALPIGISFYTFQILSYTIDVYRGSVPVQKNVIDFATYVALFPQLIAGPIVRYSDVASQLRERQHTLDGIAYGIRRFILGLAKKVLIANVLGEIGGIFRTAEQPTVLFYWLYAVSFMLQIYYDFSGYSDMAIGLGRIFGFKFAENFDYPYISKSITEFWRRWHMSLGTWFRDYVYIPLGGNRKGIGRQIFNILVVWMLTGFWHGAAWNFILWGLYFAVLLILEKLWLKKRLDRHPAIGHIYVLAAVLFGFVLFNAETLTQTVQDIAGMFSFCTLPLVSTESLYYLRSYALPLLVGAIGATPLLKRCAHAVLRSKHGKYALNFFEPIALCLLLLVSTAYLVDGSFNPFLYFRF